MNNRDLLKRHSINHNNDQPNKRLKTSQSTPRSRTAKACIACAESKLRCGPSRPCDRCKARGISCDFHETRKSGVDSSPARQRSSIGDNSMLGTDGHQSISSLNASQPIFNHDEMQAASSLQQMPSAQYISPHSGQTNGFGSVPSFQGNQLPNMASFDHSNVLLCPVYSH